MTERIIFLAAIFCAVLSLEAQAQTVPNGRRLRVIVDDLYGNTIIIGATTGSWSFGSPTGTIMDQEFSYVTPENDFKQTNIHPDNSTWDWTKADSWVDHITENNQVLRMHGPIGPQCSNWARDDNRTPAELETNLNEFMTGLCSRYNGVTGFISLDVVNEVAINGSWHTNKPGTGWECPWYIIGLDTDPNNTPLYIKMAFELADQYAPDMKLIFNHHEHAAKTDSWDLIKETVLYLRNYGLRVDGIGWQAHVSAGWDTVENLNLLRDLIDWAHNNNLEFHVTEASVFIYGAPNPANLEAQAQTYRAIVDVLIEKRLNGMVGWSTWHIDDAHGWNTELYPALFDSNYVAKPAYYAIQDALESGSTGVQSPELSTPTLATFGLSNSPNPFTSMTSLSYEITRGSNVNINVYNLAGQIVANPVSEYRDPGNHSIDWYAGDLSPGMYFCQMDAYDIIETELMILIE